MISKRAVRKFFNRPLRDYRKWKKLKPAQLEAIKETKLRTEPPIWKKLKRHQKVLFLVGVKTRRFGIFADTGCGKTLISIALIRFFKKANIIRRTLVLVPTKLNTDEWLREFNKHSPQTKVVVLSGSSEHKWKQLEQNASVFVTTYAGLFKMVTTKEYDSKKNQNKLKPNKTLVTRLQRNFEALIMDESTECKNIHSLPYRVCRQLSKTCKVVYALTGTPFGRDPQDLWAQLYLVDQGETLGTTMGMFREAFFTKKQNGFGGFDYTFDQRLNKDLHRMLANRTIRYKANEADLPKRVHIIKKVKLSSDAETFYQEAKEEVIRSRGNFEEMGNAFMRLRQISSGFISYTDDETGEREHYEIQPNPKLDLLLEQLQTIGPDHKVVVFHDFIVSGDAISRRLQEAGIAYARAYSKTKNPQQERERFESDPECRVFLLNSDMGAFGLNLQVAQYLIFYESPVPVITRKQCIARVERQYSKHEKVFLIDLVMARSVDEQILEFHQEGKELFDALIEGKVTPR